MSIHSILCIFLKSGMHPLLLDLSLRTLCFVTIWFGYVIGMIHIYLTDNKWLHMNLFWLTLRLLALVNYVTSITPHIYAQVSNGLKRCFRTLTTTLALVMYTNTVEAIWGFFCLEQQCVVDQPKFGSASTSDYCNIILSKCTWEIMAWLHKVTIWGR